MNESLTETGRSGEETARKKQARRQPPPQPVWVYLLLLVAVTLIPALIFSVILLQRNNEAQQDAVFSLAEAMAGSISETVDRELSGMLTTLRVLSTSPSLAEDRAAVFHVRARAALADTSDVLTVLDLEMNQLINTRERFGTALGTFSDPEPVHLAFELGEPVISNVFRSEVSQKWVFNVILPWQGNQGPIALVLTRNAEDLSAALAGRNLRGGWNAAVIDRDHTVVASSYLSSDVGNPFFLDLDTSEEGRRARRRFTHDGVPFETIITNSQMSGWRIVLWAPAANIEQPMRQSLQVFVLGGLVMIFIGAGAAWLLAHQVARPVSRLARDARRLGAGEMVRAADYPVSEITTISHALAQAAEDRQKAENEIRILMREVAHRSKNQLTVISAIAKQTARHASTFDDFQERFQRRVQGLARSTDLLIEGGVAGVELWALIETQIEPFRPETDGRLSMKGPLVRLSNQAAQTMGLAFHELATNAAKYGAFASRSGTLSISWRLTGDDIELVWREKTPAIAEGGRERGFGTEVIERMVGGTLDARIERTLHEDGIEYRFNIPREKIRPSAEPPAL